VISHVFIGINDFELGFAFYSAVMRGLGHTLKFCERDTPWSGTWAGWMAPDVPRPLFIVGTPYDGRRAEAGNGQMVALLAPGRACVDSVHAIALANGGTCEGPPGLRPQYHPHYYGAYFRDPEGNKLGVCCHDPVPE